MQSISHISLLVSGTAQYDVQERIRVAERAALVRAAKRHRPSIVAASRLVIGQFMVGFGRRIAGHPRRQERALDAPAAFKIAR
jgi:uncharacterized membrane protein YedE/YeeE